jgi:starch-binding outer membrane protein, SusD/RagB family
MQININITNQRPVLKPVALLVFAGYILMTIVSGCNKLVTVPPPVAQLTSEDVYNDDATAAAVLTGIYTNIALPSPENGASSVSSISLASGLSADELTLFGGSGNANEALVQYYLNALTPGDPTTNSQGSLWSDFYFIVYTVNVAINRLPNSSTLTPAVKNQLMGEAYFLRAFCFFYLVNLYDSIPLAITSDYEVTSALSRSSPSLVYRQIITDLTNASGLLTSGYVASDAMTMTSERIRPNKWAALALLARAYLYNQNYDSAALVSSEIINNTSLFDTLPLNQVFLKNSLEAIWQLQPVNAGWNTEDARVFILPPTGPTSSSPTQGFPVYLSESLLSSFEYGDQRRLNWVDSVIANGVTYYYPYKYKSASLNAPVTEYTMVLRLGEQYLIRAEAEANGGGGGIGAAVADLNVIRNRAGVGSYSGGTDVQSVLAAIMHERQTELFTEWGNRWLDLKRTSVVNSVMTVVAPLKGTVWNPNWQLYPLPAYDIAQDPSLQQNPGY